MLPYPARPTFIAPAFSPKDLMVLEKQEVGQIFCQGIITFGFRLKTSLIIMSIEMLLLVALLSIAIVLIGLLVGNSRKRKRALTQQLEGLLPDIREGRRVFVGHLSEETGYFNHFLLRQWTERFGPVAKTVGKLKYRKSYLSEEDKDLIDQFLKYSSEKEERREAFNQAFVPAEVKRTTALLSDVEGRSLDHQQRVAVVTDEDSNLVVAGAGSGKTTTVVGKVKYVMERYDVTAEELLLISFTNKATDSLKERIELEGLQAKTFHKLGKDIIAAAEGGVPTTFDEKDFKNTILQVFRTLIQDPDYLAKVNMLFTDHLKAYRPQDEFESQGAYWAFLDEQNYTTYKEVHQSWATKETMMRERVKSIEECLIANHLFFNGVSYQYEAAYEHETKTLDYKQYRPDFKITQGDKVVYLEHFGVDREGNVPKWFGKPGERYEDVKQRYNDGIRWKRELHATHGTTLVETYSFMKREGTLYEELERILTEAGIVFTPLTAEEKWEAIQRYGQNEVDAFYQLAQTFSNLWKSNDYSAEDIRQKIDQIEDKSLRDRSQAMFDILRPIQEGYEAYLREVNMIDFGDMINLATAAVTRGEYASPFRYIIIDEFQDISISRYRLIKALQASRPGCKIFCVGDDWQSIYRFAGSDISLFSSFGKYFGVHEKLKIETTYRFQDPLLATSSDFVMANPNQTAKKLRGLAGKRTTYSIEYIDKDFPGVGARTAALFNNLLSLYPGIEEKEILILGRYNLDRNRLSYKYSPFEVSPSLVVYRKGGQSLRAKFMTIHKAKGLEADIVILINCSTGKYGFPSQMSDDPMLNLVLSQADQFENGEERRLFYVALTRAKEHAYLVCDHRYKSKFILELEGQDTGAKVERCPECKTGRLVYRSGVSKKGNPYAMYGCSNFSRGCGFKRWA
ncbi:AAA family ATPase [Neolewinella aurantiaca]|uniref:DNA 3'-5' helicase n=1 Tax=Neolewinella aurantiaca TaxID=2602767 RepID=A0A5C7EZM1_9BACT|nr:UvrD-helicase domain-containing protein [Neolewinella aurantiaca]TXF81857.1 AAA family ATPase [Neolewinella aurantiaca]